MTASTPPAEADAGAAAGRRTFVVRSRSEAPVDAVWPLVAEGRRWKEWTFLTRSQLERTGTPPPDGVGAVRRFTRYGVGSREEVVAWEPPHHLGYTMLSGFPVRHYRADVTLEADGSGTSIAWSVGFEPRVPGTGWVMTVVLRRIVTGFATALARHAAAPTAT